MEKIISFSLWGDKAMYGVGAILNAQLAQEHFPEWTCVFYYDKTVPGIYIKALEQFDNVLTVKIEDGSYGAFWRLYPMRENTIVLSRDCDSRLSARERRIIDEWLETDSNVCIMRDHIRHYDFFILTGMLAVRNGLPDSIFEDMNKIIYDTRYASEQIFIGNSIKAKMLNDCKIFGIKETPWMYDTYSEIGKDFIGQSYNDNGEPIYEPLLKE